MKTKDSSSWSEIKSLDEHLAKEPDSYCFARLSEIYLKVGLVADALHTARQGVAKHPGYLAGQRALAMALNANGLYDESRITLEQLTAATPEDADAQKLLANLYVEAGDKASAIRVFRTLLDFRPYDAHCKVQLEELQRPDTVEHPQAVTAPEAVVCGEKVEEEAEAVEVEAEAVEEEAEAVEEEAEVVEKEAEVVEKEAEVVEKEAEVVEVDAEEEVYELSEDDVVTDEDEISGKAFEQPALPVVAEGHDPLSTPTLAELYEQQGLIAKALDIYRTLLADNPANAQLQAKVSQLEQQEPSAETLPERFETAEVADEPEPDTPVVFESRSIPAEPQDFSPLVHSQADNVVEVLDSLLENIRRIKACR
jgi:tetratricopeptide (TPR) repeat protein